MFDMYLQQLNVYVELHPISAVIGRKFPTPSRANAASRLASLKVSPADFRPSLSAGISGTAFMDAASMSSYVSSVPGGGSIVDGLIEERRANAAMAAPNEM